MTPRLILASTSPRRYELMGLLGLPFEVVASRYDEALVDPFGMAPAEYVMRLASGKAAEVAGRMSSSVLVLDGNALDVNSNALVIGADTTVVLDGSFLNKPKDAADARRMLRGLSGRTHEVYTGLCLIYGSKTITEFAVTEVMFDPLTDKTIAAYVAGGEPLDKAGAYGIQGQALSFIPGIQGDYFNVVGLPLEYLRNLLLPYFPDIAPAPSQPTFPDPVRYGRVEEVFAIRRHPPQDGLIS